VTPFHHQPEAQHPKSSAIHKLPADYPIYGSESAHPRMQFACQLGANKRQGSPCSLWVDSVEKVPSSSTL